MFKHAAPYFTGEQSAAVLGYTNIQSFYHAAKNGTLPVPAYKLNRQWVIDTVVMQEYFLRYREEGLTELNQQELRKMRDKVRRQEQAAHARRFAPNNQG